MKYVIRGKNIEVTAAMSNYLENELDKLEKFEQVSSDDIAKVDVRFYNEKEARITAVIDIKGKNNLLKADAEDPDYYKAVEKLRKELERQVKKIKEKSHEGQNHNKEKFSEFLVKEEEKNEEKD